LIRVSTAHRPTPRELAPRRDPSLSPSFVHGQPLQSRKFHHRFGQIDGFSQQTDAFISAGDLRQRLAAEIVRDLRARYKRESGLIHHLLERQRANFADSLLELGNREGRGVGVVGWVPNREKAASMPEIVMERAWGWNLQTPAKRSSS
jgi:hypothetical protein